MRLATTVVSASLFRKPHCNADLIAGGSIAIDPEPNYGETPVISKEYAKLRKEFHQLKQTSTTSKANPATQSPNSPFYVIAESSGSSSQKIHRTPGNFGTTRHFTGIVSQPSTKNPYYYQTYGKDNASQKNELDKAFPAVYYATTNYKFQNTNYKRPVSTTYKPNNEQDVATVSIKDRNKGYENRRIPDYEDSDTSILKLMNSLLETHLGSDDGSPTESSWSLDLLDSLFGGNEAENKSVAEETTVSQIKETDDTEPSSATETATTAPFDYESESSTSDSTERSSLSTLFMQETTYDANFTTQDDTTTETVKQDANNPVTFKNILNTTDCKENEISDVEHRHSVNAVDASTVAPVDASEVNTLQEVTHGASTEDGATSTEHDITEVDLEYKVDVAKATLKPLPKIELLQNLTKMKEEGLDYDYKDLPPSLPNLR